MILHFIRHCIKIKLMKKLLLTLLLLGSILPSVEAGVSPEGIPRRPRNFSPEGRLRPRKCTRFNPCIPRDYYRPNPPRRIPMPLRYNLPNG